MIHTIVTYAVIAFISFLQGYTFVPQYTYCYIAFFYVARVFHLPLSGERCDNVASNDNQSSGYRLLDVALEVFSLACALALLIIIYLAYFEFAFVPQHINKVWLSMFVIGLVCFRVRQEMRVANSQSKEPIYVEFSNIDDQGRVRLDSFWTLRDLERYLVRLEDGVELPVWGNVKAEEGKEDRLNTSGVVSYDEKSNGWVVSIDWAKELERNKVSYTGNRSRG